VLDHAEEPRLWSQELATVAKDKFYNPHLQGGSGVFACIFVIFSKVTHVQSHLTAPSAPGEIQNFEPNVAHDRLP